MNEEIKFTKEHYYLIIENGLVTVGLTDYILDKIKDNITSIELSDIANIYSKNDIVGTIYYDNDEMQLYTPLTGEIAEINDNLIDEPENMVNLDIQENWLFKIYPSNLEEIMDEILSEEEYNDYLETL